MDRIEINVHMSLFLFALKAWYACDLCWMTTNMDSDRKITGRGKRSTHIKTSIIACVTSTNSVQTSLALNLGLRGDESVSNGLACAAEEEVTVLEQTRTRACVCVCLCYLYFTKHRCYTKNILNGKWDQLHICEEKKDHITIMVYVFTSFA